MFKCFMLVLFFSTVSFTAQAEKWQEACASLGKLSETIMTNRQAGISLADMIKAVSAKEFELSDIVQNLIFSAYDRSRYNSPEMQMRAVEDFRDEVYLQCVKKLR